MTINHIVKRDGSLQEFDPLKLNKWMEFAYQNDTIWSDISLRAVKKIYDKCTTVQLQEALIKTCLEYETDKSLKAAGRLYLPIIIKNVFPDNTVTTFKDQYYRMIDLGFYRDFNLSDNDLDFIESKINHQLDYAYTYTVLKQLVDKYIIKDVATGKLYETPQFTYMRVAIYVAHTNSKTLPVYDHQSFLNDIISYYEDYSSHDVNLPSPNMVYLGTVNKTGASCCLIECEDSIDSIDAKSYAVSTMTVAGAGIGSLYGVRSLMDPIKKGTIEHQGKLPYFRVLQSLVGANKQNSRGGAATTYVCSLDPEIEIIIKLRNPKSIESRRIPGIDYNIKLHPFLIEAINTKTPWMLISLYHAPDLYAKFDSDDYEGFKELYFKYLNNSDVPKTLIKAVNLAALIAKEPFESGRLYKFNSYEVNHHTPFLEPIKMSNLCVEITLVTGALLHVKDLFKTHEADYYEIIYDDGSTELLHASEILKVNGEQINVENVKVGDIIV